MTQSLLTRVKREGLSVDRTGLSVLAGYHPTDLVFCFILNGLDRLLPGSLRPSRLRPNGSPLLGSVLQ